MSILETFPHPNVVNRDPQQLTQDIVNEAQVILGKTIYPAQVERLLANLQAHRETQARFRMQYAYEMSLVSFAVGVHLDYLGELVDTFRLGESPARATAKFTLSQRVDQSVTIPKGTRLSALARLGQIHFLTVEDRVIRGDLAGGPLQLDDEGRPCIEVGVEANTVGVLGNGFNPGELSVVLDQIPFLESAQNTTQTSQGLPVETDERYRSRIKLAMEKAVGSSEDGYRYLVLSADRRISDVSVYTEVGTGKVEIFPLMVAGLPTDQDLVDVSKAVGPRQRRALTDWVQVRSPIERQYVIDVTIVPFVGANTSAINAQALKDLNLYVTDRNARVALDFVPSQIIEICQSIQGVYRVIVNSPGYEILGPSEWGNCTGVNVFLSDPEVG